MGQRVIVKMGHPALVRVAEKVENPSDPEIAALVADMIDTMNEAGGIGLAAPQVGVGLQLVIFSVPAGRTEEGDSHGLTILLNPEITPLSPETELGYEACLSVPGLTALVPRWKHIHYQGIDLDGEIIAREAHGFHARVVQHECDHLWGRLYLSRLPDLSSLAYRDELVRHNAESDGV